MTRLSWRAARDGVGHGHWATLPRTLCGIYVVSEALAWPERLRCVECIAAAEQPVRPSEPLSLALPPATGEAMVAFSAGATTASRMASALGITRSAARGRLGQLRNRGLGDDE